MATQTVKMVIQLRRDVSANWEMYKDVVPAAGEPCFVMDQNILKIGDGVTTFENLEPIAGENIKLSADNKSVALEDGVFKLMGIDAADVGAQPTKAADGSIKWVMPVDITDLKSSVSGLQSSVSALQKDVKTIQEIVSPSGDDAVPLLLRVETLENKVDGTGEGTIDAKIDKKINDFANKISDDGTINTIKELADYVEAHGGEFKNVVADVTTLQKLVGEDSVQNQIAYAIGASGHIAKSEAVATLTPVKYEIAHKPDGALVDYRDKEIRVMCPADTQWSEQAVGANGNANYYYMGVKAYAPEGAVSFKEDDRAAIEDQTMYYFDNNQFAGIDQYGRKYSIIWLALASYNESTDTWSYLGAKSTTSKYVGWYYSVEWYDADGKKIASDCIRINLSNESCYSAVEPYYMAGAIKGVKVNGTLLDAVDGVVDIAISEQSLGVKGSDEITIAEDGTLGVGKISFSKIAQDDDDVIIMDGGSSTQ